MILYTKNDCEKCDHVKNAFDLNDMGIATKMITADDPEILADLAWHELIEVVEKGALPILLLDDGSHVNNVVPIKKYLKKNFSRAAAN